MCSDQLKVYLDRLRGGAVEQLTATLSPDLLHTEANEVRFSEPISVVGEAYIAGEYLVLCLTIETTVAVPCRICSQETRVSIRLEQNYTMEELSTIRARTYDGKQLVRELILVEVPLVAECHAGNCPRRDEMAPYLKKKE